MSLGFPRLARAGVAAGLAVACLALNAASTSAAANSVRSQEWWLQALHVTQAWHSTRASGVTVAVLDTGVYPNQADLRGAVTTGPDYTHSGRVHGGPFWGIHGTAIASLIAGRGHGASAGAGMMGVAPAASILSVRVTLESNDPLLADANVAGGLPGAIARGIRYAVNHHASVIDLPLDPVTVPGSPGVGGSSAEKAAVAYALAHHVVLVAPAGDEGAGADPVNFPASYKGVISVGAFDSQFNKASFSSHQPYVTLTAARGRGHRGQRAHGIRPDQQHRRGQRGGHGHRRAHPGAVPGAEPGAGDQGAHAERPLRAPRRPAGRVRGRDRGRRQGARGGGAHGRGRAQRGIVARGRCPRRPAARRTSGARLQQPEQDPAHRRRHRGGHLPAAGGADPHLWPPPAPAGQGRPAGRGARGRPARAAAQAGRRRGMPRSTRSSRISTTTSRRRPIRDSPPASLPAVRRFPACRLPDRPLAGPVLTRRLLRRPPPHRPWAQGWAPTAPGRRPSAVGAVGQRERHPGERPAGARHPRERVPRARGPGPPDQPTRAASGPVRPRRLVNTRWPGRADRPGGPGWPGRPGPGRATRRAPRRGDSEDRAGGPAGGLSAEGPAPAGPGGGGIPGWNIPGVGPGRGRRQQPPGTAHGAQRPAPRARGHARRGGRPGARAARAPHAAPRVTGSAALGASPGAGRRSTMGPVTHAAGRWRADVSYGPAAGGGTDARDPSFQAAEACFGAGAVVLGRDRGGGVAGRAEGVQAAGPVPA